MIDWRAHLPAPSWRLLAIIGLLAAGVWVWQNGPANVSPQEYQHSLRPERFDAAQRARLTILRDRRELGWDLEFDSWVRNVAPAVVADHRAGNALSIRWPADTGLRVVERGLIDELMSHPELQRVTTEEIAIGVHAVRSTMPDGIASTRDDASVMGTFDGVDYCVTVVSYADDYIDRGIFPENAAASWYRGEGRGSRSSFLDGCTFAHRYGLPGPSVLGWLEQNGVVRPRATEYANYRAFEVPTSEDFDLGSIFLGSGFGRSNGLVRRVCLAGGLSECMRQFDPESAGFPRAHGPVVIQSGTSLILSTTQGDPLSHLEHDFGEEAFLEFWTSELPFEEAFRSAFGIGPAEWTHRELLEVSGPVRAGPFPVAGSIFTSAWLALLAMLFGIFFARRRTV